MAAPDLARLYSVLFDDPSHGGLLEQGTFEQMLEQGSPGIQETMKAFALPPGPCSGATAAGSRRCGRAAAR